MTYKVKHKTLPYRGTKAPLSVISSVETIMFRIKYAKTESPIAVFISDKVIGLVAVFGSTVKTKRLAIKQNQNFVGMFDRNCDLKNVEFILSRALVI